jgi:imidazolonepropionase-like amidohydrolase
VKNVEWTFLEAEFPPIELWLKEEGVLMGSTSFSARRLQVGNIKPSTESDIIAVNWNPLKCPSVLHTPHMIMKAGEIYRG